MDLVTAVELQHGVHAGQEESAVSAAPGGVLSAGPHLEGGALCHWGCRGRYAAALHLPDTAGTSSTQRAMPVYWLAKGLPLPADSRDCGKNTRHQVGRTPSEAHFGSQGDTEPSAIRRHQGQGAVHRTQDAVAEFELAGTRKMPAAALNSMRE